MDSNQQEHQLTNRMELTLRAVTKNPNIKIVSSYGGEYWVRNLRVCDVLRIFRLFRNGTIWNIAPSLSHKYLLKDIKGHLRRGEFEASVISLICMKYNLP